MATTHKFTLTGLGVRPPQGGDVAVQRSQLFPTTIWQVRLTTLSGQCPGWVSHVTALRAASPKPAGRTNRQGWNSADSAVLDHPAFADLDQAIRGHCRMALDEMGAQGAPFTLQSWINVHDRGGFNFLHMHDGALLSGCFYLQVPQGSGSLTFRDPRPGVLHSPFKGSGPNACKEVNLRPDAGLLVLFPHWLEHYVEPHESDVGRIVIAFNALNP
jgi:uncharacterized protein (TIGR02466 family)